ncbi:MAG: helix-turn-helix transcriptional regulator [Ruminococcus sp.]|nr:helix-turn-helix transcriptional regulator [Ruminococcus sp.]
MKFGERLRALIEERNITQKELANKLNIAPSTVSSYAQSTREPDFETLKMIANYFNVTTDYLLGYKPSNSNTTSQEDDLLRVFRDLSADQKEICLEQCKVFIKINQKN